MSRTRITSDTRKGASLRARRCCGDCVHCEGSGLPLPCSVFCWPTVGIHSVGRDTKPSVIERIVSRLVSSRQSQLAARDCCAPGNPALQPRGYLTGWSAGQATKKDTMALGLGTGTRVSSLTVIRRYQRSSRPKSLIT